MKSAEMSCGTLIKHIHDALVKHANNELRKNDLTYTQIGVLFTLNKKPEKQASMKELEQMLHIAQSTTAGLITRLEQKGLVESFGDPSDKRVKMVHITPLGEECCTQTRMHVAQMEEHLLSDLTVTEKEILHSLLRKVYSSLK